MREWSELQKKGGGGCGSGGARILVGIEGFGMGEGGLFWGM